MELLIKTRHYPSRLTVELNEEKRVFFIIWKGLTTSSAKQ